MTPKCLRIIVAIGQLSTDSFRAHGAEPIGLQATLVRPKVIKHPRSEAGSTQLSAVGWSDTPPGLQPRAKPCPKTEPTVGDRAGMEHVIGDLRLLFLGGRALTK